QRLAGLPCQQPTQMPLARTPVQPVRCRLLPAMTDACGEMGDLLPFAAGNVAAEQVCSLPRFSRRAGARQPGIGCWSIERQLAQFEGALGQLGEGSWCSLEQMRLVVRRFGLLQSAAAQPV